MKLTLNIYHLVKVTFERNVLIKSKLINRYLGLTACTNKKRQIFTNLNPLENNTDFAYQSTPNYLRQATQHTSFSPSGMNTGPYLSRAQSATDLTPRSNIDE